MADKKISELPSITNAALDKANDVLPVVDTSESATKKITVNELFTDVDVTGTVTAESLGIGTDAPQAPMHISEPHNDTTPSGEPVEVLRLEVKEALPNPNLVVGDGVKMSFYIPEAVYSSHEGAAIFAVKTSDTDSNSDTALIFNTAANDAALVEAMRIDSDSKVLVNRATPYSDGTIGNPVFQVNADTGSFAGIAVISTATTSTNAVGFVNPNGTIGNINTSGSSTTYNTTSDYRLKDNVTPIQGASDIVKAMNPCTYTFKSDSAEWHDGFLAHELQDLHPRAVSGEKDAMRDEEYEITPATETEGAVMGIRSTPQYQSVDYSKLTPILTAALKEALIKVEDLETRLAVVEGVK